MLRKILLICGIISTVWYSFINIIVPSYFPGYNIASQTVSELSAIDSPSRSLWVTLCIFYSLLMIAFGLGVWLKAEHNKKLLFVAAVIIFDGIFGFFWPPMHLREVIAAGGGTITDTLHIAWAFVHLGFVLLMIGFGAAVFGKGFCIYSIVTVAVFILFGILSSIESSGIESGKPTPYIGIWERINIGAYMIWIIVFSFKILRKQIPKRKVVIL